MENDLLIQKYESAKQKSLLNKTEIAKKRAQINYIDEIEHKSAEINKKDLLINNLNTQLQGKKSEITKKESEATEIQLKLSKASKQSSTAKSDGTKDTSSEELNSRLDTLNAEIKTLKGEEDALNTQLKALITEKNDLASQKVDLTSKLTDSKVSKSDLESQLTPIEKELSKNNEELNNIRKEALHANLSFVDKREKTGETLFKVDNAKFELENPSAGTNIKIKISPPHKMSDKDILINFKDLGDYALKWIFVCPSWQHPRLMKLYDDFIANYDDYVIKGDFKNANASAATPQAIVTKADAGIYSYHPSNKVFSKFKKESALGLNETVTIIEENTILDGKENYIKVKYIKGQNLKEQKFNEVQGYVKTKNLTFKGFTPDMLSTAQSSDEFTKNLSSTTTKWLSKTRESATESATGETKSEYNLNNTDTATLAKFPNPAFMSDKQIYDTFSALNSKYGDCEKWIDTYLVHKKRLTNIYDIFSTDLKDTSGKKSGDSLSTVQPETLLAKITEKNANVYVKDAGDKLNRVGNLKEGNYVKVEIEKNSTSSDKVTFKFINFENKKYVPIVCLSEGKILYGYVNSNFITFLTTDNESIIQKASDSQTVDSSDDDSSNIKVLEDTVKNQHTTGSGGGVPTDPNMLKNPLFMSDKEIAQNFTSLGNDFERIYEWAKSFPLQTKRIKELYASEQPVDKLDDHKPKSIMATVTRSETHVYLADGDAIKDSGSNVKNNHIGSGKTQHFNSYGKLKKGAKVKLQLDAASDGITNPVFVYHKDADNKNSKYVKIQFLDSNYLYQDGFISVNSISTYTVEQEMEEILSTIISSNDENDSNFDFSLSTNSGWDYAEQAKSTFISPVGDTELSFRTLKRPDGTVVKDENGEDVEFDNTIVTDDKGNPVFNEDGTPKKKENVSFNKDTFSITTGSFGVASSLFGIVVSVKDYAEKFDVQTAINAELVGIMSSGTSLVSSTLGLAKSSISSENSNAKNLELAGDIFKILSTSFDTLKLLWEETPKLLEMIKKREGPELDAVISESIKLLGSANSILGLLSKCSTVIPIVSAYLSAVSSAIQLLYDFVQFVQYERQIWKMYNTKKDLKNEYNIQGQKEKRAEELQALNGEIEKLQFKGKKRTSTENTELQAKLEKRSQYMDLFITTELETINKKRRNRKIVKLTEDTLNLTGDILGIISVSVPDPHTIVATTLAKIGVKAGAAAVGLGAAAARGIKQWWRDLDKDDPNNTRNKQIKYGKVAAGMINNLIRLPLPKPLPEHPTQADQDKHKAEEDILTKRYTLVESHIIASGASISDLAACKGDVSQIFRIIYAALLKRE